MALRQPLDRGADGGIVRGLEVVVHEGHVCEAQLHSEPIGALLLSLPLSFVEARDQGKGSKTR
jgi:hypothetical protein